MKTLPIAGALFATFAAAAGPAAQEVTFRDTFAVTDTGTGDHVLSSRLENRSDRGRDVFVTTPDGVTRKVGRLAPGERARVTAVPGFPGGGLFIFDRE